jgi:O-acetyl-ADP-ribose deacetylase (regulator of RNase III)
MGKGIAKDFKLKYPEMYQQYRQFCQKGSLKIGTLWIYRTSPKWILTFPTKEHWKNPSRLEFIEIGLQKFVQTYEKQKIQSIAFPKLGCGNGQLN